MAQHRFRFQIWHFLVKSPKLTLSGQSSQHEFCPKNKNGHKHIQNSPFWPFLAWMVAKFYCFFLKLKSINFLIFSFWYGHSRKCHSDRQVASMSPIRSHIWQLRAQLQYIKCRLRSHSPLFAFTHAAHDGWMSVHAEKLYFLKYFWLFIYFLSLNLQF